MGAICSDAASYHRRLVAEGGSCEPPSSLLGPVVVVDALRWPKRARRTRAGCGKANTFTRCLTPKPTSAASPGRRTSSPIQAPPVGRVTTHTEESSTSRGAQRHQTQRLLASDKFQDDSMLSLYGVCRPRVALIAYRPSLNERRELLTTR